MTYRELKAFVESLSDEHLDCTATVYLEGKDEYIEVNDTTFTVESEDDVLDDNHPILLVNF